MLGFVHYCNARFSWWDDRETALSKAEGYAKKALGLDFESADAQITASVVSMLKGSYSEAVVHARKALDLAPGSADVATFACFVLAPGFPKEAALQGERALTLSPRHPAYYLGHLGHAYRLSGDFEKAIAAFKSYDARSPGFGLADLVITYQQSGRLPDAKQTAERLMSVRSDFSIAASANTQIRIDSVQLADEIKTLRATGLPD